MMQETSPVETKKYVPLPTLRQFHESGGQIRCIIGPVGSGKTSAATWELCYYLPKFLFDEYGMTDTKWVVVRNTYSELFDTTKRTVTDWFSWGEWKAGDRTYTLRYPEGFTVEILFRSCDNPDDIKKFKSLELTGYWIDESIEVADEIKKMLKNRIGRYPQKSPVRFGIETSNPPDVEHNTYSDFDWIVYPPGPIPQRDPLPNHIGFWQPARENEPNLRPHYYDDLINDYRDNKDWIEMYVEGKPGVTVQGRLVYNNFKRDYHVAKEPLIWAKGELWRGWDNSGNCPACVVVQQPRPRHIQVLREFHTDKMGIVDFGKYVTSECNMAFPGAIYQDWGDPAGAAQYSKREGGFTSNAQLMAEECGITVQSSEQNWMTRKESVEKQLSTIDGMLIDPSCTRLINGFIAGYAYDEIGTTGRFAESPMKNRFSHTMESLQYVLLKMTGGSSGSGNDGFVPRRGKR